MELGLIPKLLKFLKNRIKRKKSLLVKDKKELGKELTKSLIENKLQKNTISSLKRKLTLAKGKDYEKREYYNNKYKKAEIVYNARNNKSYDVRSFITIPSIVLSNLKKEIRVYDSDSNDTKALKILKWVATNFTYKSDDGEYWSFPTDFLYTRHGDCEDFSHLIVSLMINLGIPNYRVKVACGWATHRDTLLNYGHSYPIYLREFDDEWVHLDPVFYPDITTAVKNRVKAKDNSDYGEIWFTFNNLHSWGDHDITTTGRIINEEVR